MSTNRNRQSSQSVTDNHSYRLILFNELYPPYYDEGDIYYPIHNRGTCMNGRKRIMNYQRRMYRTWKHNRTSQWK